MKRLNATQLIERVNATSISIRGRTWVFMFEPHTVLTMRHVLMTAHLLCEIMKYILFQSLMMFCCIFAAATVIRSGYQLVRGVESDTNYHILLHAMITLVGVIAWQPIRKFNFKFRIFNIIVPYGILLSTELPL
jgi:hypothetical protein